ncbi:MAG: hypothetical protein ACTSW4_01595 [Candidatus Ranarchaeia archaeon]
MFRYYTRILMIIGFSLLVLVAIISPFSPIVPNTTSAAEREKQSYIEPTLINSSSSFTRVPLYIVSDNTGAITKNFSDNEMYQGSTFSLSSTHFTVYSDTTYAQHLLDALEHSWELLVSTHGFLPPPTDPIDVYVSDLPDNILGVTYYYYNPQNPSVRRISNITIDSGLSAIELNQTAAHEFFHCIQLAYDIINEDNWLVEGMANFIMLTVYPGYYVNYLDWAEELFYVPDTSLPRLSYGYEAAVFWKFVYDHYGGMPLIRSIWESCAVNGLDNVEAVDQALQAFNSTFDNVFVEWAAANFNQSRYLLDIYPGITFADSGNFSGTQIKSNDRDVAGYASDYYEITIDQMLPIDNLSVIFNGELPSGFYVQIFMNGTNLSRQIMQIIQIHDDSYGDLIITNLHEISSISIIVSYLGDPPIKVGYNFSVVLGELTVNGPNPQIIQISLSPDPVVYSQPIFFNVSIEDNGVPLNYVLLQVWLNNGWNNYTMSPTGTFFTYLLPAPAYGNNITFRIFAENINGASGLSLQRNITVGDNTSPNITKILAGPTFIIESHSINLTIYANDGVNASGIALVQIQYRVDGSEWSSLNATYIGNNGYIVTLPAITFASKLEYRVVVIDNAGNTGSSPENNKYFSIYAPPPEGLSLIGRIGTWLFVGIGIIGFIFNFRRRL